jgi:hypothetical protein
MTPREFGRKIAWLGHCTAGTSDKIWGFLDFEGTTYTFWGRRTGPWTFRNLGAERWRAEGARDIKRFDHGYRGIEPRFLYPEFLAELQTGFARACLTNRFHGEGG